MKSYFNYTLKFVVILFVLTLFLTNCEKEAVVEKEQIVEEAIQEKLIKIEDVSVNEIPQIKRFLNRNPIVTKSVTNKGVSSKTDETAFGTVDFSNIKKLTDTLGQVTYTFRMIKPSTQTSEVEEYYFDNLVIKVLGDKSDYEAYILRYTYGGEYKEVDYEYYGLSGKIEHYPLTETSFGLDFIDPGLTARDSCRLYVVSDCGMAGHHSSLDYPCQSQTLSVTIYVECFGLSDEILISGNYVNPDDTGGDPSHGGSGRPGSTSPVNSPYDALEMSKYDALDRLLNLRNWEFAWLYKLENHETAMQIYDFLEKDASDEAKEFAEYVIKILMANPDANPFLGSDCRSFEYAQPPGALQKGCAVKNFDHRFYTTGVRSNGSPYYGEIDINIDTAYFTMPSWMSNGRAANLTALAVTAAIKSADLYFFSNPDVTKFKLAEVFKDAINAQLSLVGGSLSSVAPFPIPNPAPYVTSVLGISNPFDCD
ncbi:hypothetical protein [Flavivirga algicola]|uniref:Lipoprotein n=1 Tax=Flavivirga algicola TaxID=2729136 RepID=A0ABX1S4M7_9FLAO|nr:hypothetical protein [Flavivirga algicola]NMH89823.1 hypothetical protein [Flavivirga algicola]